MAEARRHRRRPRILDSLIAATARALDVPVYTQDADFDDIAGVRVVHIESDPCRTCVDDLLRSRRGDDSPA